ncbi:hypothetical protein OQJ19_05170 [Fluoribacter gormanii]|uniref:hypothetical protein n=1 Tax=Fluoribacter gormanii TaxID=464 RepID=UPI0022435B23|nr:hypothetical protein [Fluoribacter gormanii]MCW8470049.1 hypothetical protein [Fluoribacter gormanii]
MATNKFHYIWMGRVPSGKYEDAFKNGPNALAQQLKDYVMDIKKNRDPNAPNPQDQEIIMWVPEAIIEGIKEAGYLDPDITLKPIEDLYKDAKHLTQEERENLKKTVDLLGEHNAYSAQKDILEAAILEEYGGYYLDTTSIVTSIEQLINNQPKDIWFPRITEEAQKYYDGKAYVLPDVWAMYNPTPGEGTCKAMLNGYIQRCQFYFPEHFEGVQLDIEKLKDRSGYDLKEDDSYGAGSELMSSEYRDDLIGQLVIFALYDGLQQTKGPLNNAIMRRLSSYAEDTSEGKHIAKFGIDKFHKGTWRQEAIADNIEDRKEERQTQVALDDQIQEVAQDEQIEELVTLEITSPSQEIASPPQDRFHMFTVQGDDFENFKAKYQSLKGDILKSQIIRDFENKLSEIDDKDTLNHFVADFKKSTSYAVLSKGQGLTTRFFSLDTDSVTKINEMIDAKIFELDGKKLSIS